MTEKTIGNNAQPTFADLIAAAYCARGARGAKTFLRLAANAHLLLFRGRQRIVILEERHENSSFKCNAE